MRIEDLSPDPNNCRRAIGDLSKLTASIKAQGVLMPILARPAPEGCPTPLQIVCGERRWRAAEKAGLVDVPVEVRDMTDGEARAAQLAENIQRESMSPADEWLAVSELQSQHGYSLQQAGALLGMDSRKLRQMTLLGKMHPAVLAAVREFGMPEPSELREIAGAPHDRQLAALNAHTTRTGKGKKATAYLNWWNVSRACATDRIGRKLAIFDVAKHPGMFEEDLFAEPGDDPFFTTDYSGFIAAQRDALEKLVEARKAEGWNIVYGFAAPAGYRPQTAPAYVGPDGSISKIPAYDGDERLLLACVNTAEGRIGSVRYAIGMPAAERKRVPVVDHERAPPSPRAEIAKRGQAMVAAGKSEGIRRALDNSDLTAQRLLHLVLVTLAAGNVTVRGEDGLTVDFEDLAAQLVARDGTLSEVDDEQLRRSAVTAMQRTLFVAPPDARQPGSGEVADWVGAAVHAVYHTPRFDTAEFLEHCSAGMLRELAQTAGVKAKTATALRELLVGKAPEWRPLEYAAKGPEPDLAEEELVALEGGEDEANSAEADDQEAGA